MKLLRLLNFVLKPNLLSFLRRSGLGPKMPYKITQITNSFSNNNSKFILFKDLRKTKMNQIYENFVSLWSKSLLDPATKSSNCYAFHKAKLDSSLVCDIEDYLKEEFFNCKLNIYEMHLELIERCLESEDNINRNSSAMFVNHVFVNWNNQQRNIIKRKLSDVHLTASCKDKECFCNKDDKFIEKAFNLSLAKNVSMLSSFNKVYNFNENCHLLNANIDEALNVMSVQDKAILVGELQMQDKVDIEKVKKRKFFLIKDLIEFKCFIAKRLLFH